jgi:hypothetical protein
VFDEEQKRTILAELLNGAERGTQPFRDTAAVVADCEMLLKMKTRHCSFQIDEALAVSVMPSKRDCEAAKTHKMALGQ